MSQFHDDPAKLRCVASVSNITDHLRPLRRNVDTAGGAARSSAASRPRSEARKATWTI
jgi:hypothetical protein